MRRKQKLSIGKVGELGAASSILMLLGNTSILSSAQVQAVVARDHTSSDFVFKSVDVDAACVHLRMNIPSGGIKYQFILCSLTGVNRSLGPLKLISSDPTLNYLRRGGKDEKICCQLVKIRVLTTCDSVRSSK